MSKTRKFLSQALTCGLKHGIVSPADILRHLNAEVLAHHLPVDAKATLLKAALTGQSFGPELVLDCLGVDTLAEHSPVSLLWECIHEAATISLEGTSAVTINESSMVAATEEEKERADFVEPLPAAPSPLANPLKSEQLGTGDGMSRARPRTRPPSSPPRSSRKPNRNTRAGATSRPSLPLVPVAEDETVQFDVDTRVGGENSLRNLDTASEVNLDNEDLTILP